MFMLLSEFRQTLEFHDVLNPALFTRNRLKKNIREHLLQIADLFRKDCNIKESDVLDIFFTGGNAAYSYTPISDVDIHLVVDFSKVSPDDMELLQDYYKDKKNLWLTKHNITIANFPVELYVQNVSESSPTGQGIYSIMKDHWVKKPKKEKIDLEDPMLINKIESWIERIRSCNSIADYKKIKEKLSAMRTSGLARGGEYSIGNLTYKSLRNLGFLDELNRNYRQMVDRGYLALE
jgi:hypothetical protein